MTEQLTGIGSVETGNPEGGNGGDATGSASQTAATGETGQQPADNLDWAKAKGWVAEDGSVKTDEVLKGYQSLEKHLGTIKKMPDEKATPEELEAFHKQLGWPGDASAYEFTRPEGLPENIPYDEGTADWFKSVANEARLPKATADLLHNKYVERFAADVAAFEAELTTKAKAAHETLVKDWGAPGTETHTKNTDAATRALRSDPKFEGLEVELKAAGLLTKDGKFTSPAIANLLAGYGKQMQNDTFVGNGSGSATENPFARETRNITQQSLLVKSDPAAARKLAVAAGWTADQLRSVFGS